MKPRYPENNMGIDSVQSMTRHPVASPVRRYEDGNQQEKRWYINEEPYVRIVDRVK